MTDNPLGALGMRSLLRLLSRQTTPGSEFRIVGCCSSTYAGHDQSIRMQLPLPALLSTAGVGFCGGPFISAFFGFPHVEHEPISYSLSKDARAKP